MSVIGGRKSGLMPRGRMLAGFGSAASCTIPACGWALVQWCVHVASRYPTMLCVAKTQVHRVHQQLRGGA
jgi:hypothetical protein